MTFLITGAVLCLQAGFALWWQWRMQGWSWTEGEVVAARGVRVEEYDDRREETHVVYRYEVEGRLYRNDRLRPGWVIRPASILEPPPDNPQIEDEIRRTLARGRRVRVYYDPRDPAESSLSTKPTWDHYLAGVLGVILLVAAAWG